MTGQASAPEQGEGAQPLAGKVAIVAGASAGVGRAYALALAGEGATVIAVARRLGDGSGAAPARNTLVEVVQAAQGLPGRVHAHACDLTAEQDVARMVEQTVVNFGRIDILVNNAGIYPRHPALEVTREQWDASLEINLRAPYLTIRHAAPHMIRQQSGSIVNITSGAAGHFPKGSPAHDGMLTYAISKAALNRLTTFMAEELKEHGVAVNAMSPGTVRTDIWETVDPNELVAKSGARIKDATPEILGPALLFLARQTAQGVTGQILHNDEFGKSWP